MRDKKDIKESITRLLKSLIQTPSLSKEEKNAAVLVRQFLDNQSIGYKVHLNNTWCFNKHFREDKPTIFLNSHIDTVKPAKGWDTDPFGAIEEDGKIIGLGSNDAGAALVCLLGTFLNFYDSEDLPYNMCFAASAEEEISGKNGIASISHVTNECSFAIIGEPTEMQMATSEKGLIVLDGETFGKTGHAARDEGINALYLAMEDISWFQEFRFPKEDPYLGPIKMTVTMIESGYQHNVVPDRCKYVVDVRTVDTYTYDELVYVIREHTQATIKPRSTRLKPSSIKNEHPLVQAANSLGIKTFGSNTLSDQSLLTIPSIKMGPGKSERSHTPGEFIYLSEISDGVDIYISLLNELFK